VYLRKGDFVIVTSDGVADNLDPENLGFEPPQLVSLLNDAEKVNNLGILFKINFGRKIS
jgi:hypothetical protein